MSPGASRRTLFRQVNERIRDVNSTFGVFSGTYDVLCECEAVDCMRRLEVPQDVYERVRVEHGQYVVTPAHHEPNREAVVSGERSFFVVGIRSREADAA